MADLKLEYNRKKLTNIVNMLAEAKRGRNLRKADVVDIAEEGVKVVKDNFPRSGGKSALEREFGPGVIDAWDVVPTSRGFGFEIANKKALKDERLNTVLAALNYGSSEYTRYVQSRERFFGKLAQQPRTRRGLFGRKYTWVTLVTGRPIKYPARKGKDFLGKAVTHIETVMLPKLAVTLRERAERKISNG